MTPKEKKIEQAFTDLQKWMFPLLKQWRQTRELGDTQSKLLFEIRDMAAGVKTPVNKAPTPPQIPKPGRLEPMEMSVAALFEKLDSRKDSIPMEQRNLYDRLHRHFEEDGHTGVSLSWANVNFLRRLYATFFFSR